jgi:hypothetical protein
MNVSIFINDAPGFFVWWRIIDWSTRNFPHDSWD